MLFLLGSLVLGAVACSASSSPGEGADSGADGSARDGASLPCGNDSCCLANQAAAGIGRECSTTEPCDPHLDCIFAPGCTAPKGKCQAWGRCPDSAIGEVVCQCDGKTGSSNFVPIAAQGDACAPADAGRE